MKKLMAILTLAASLALPGCVERALVITTEPPGADVVVNQQWKGKTPYVVPFKHYGVFDIWIEHSGYEEDGKMVTFYPMHVGEPVKAPGYQLAGADFVSEALLPGTLRDQRNLHYVLERVDQADDVDDVLERAAQLRDASRRRTELRVEKDRRRGRFTDAGQADPATPAGTGRPNAGASGPYQEYYPDSDIDATPPLPSEMPVFAQ